MDQEDRGTNDVYFRIWNEIKQNTLVSGCEVTRQRVSTIGMWNELCVVCDYQKTELPYSMSRAGGFALTYARRPYSIQKIQKVRSGTQNCQLRDMSFAGAKDNST